MEPITKETILELASSDQCVNKVVKMHRKQGIPWEEAMMIAVYYLVQHKNELIEEIMRLKMSIPSLKFLHIPKEPNDLTGDKKDV